MNPIRDVHMHTYPNWLSDARNAFNRDFKPQEISHGIEGVLGDAINESIDFGRRIRPSLFYAFWKETLGDYPKDGEAKTAQALELFHAASIVVDDLADQEDRRRNKIPIFRTFGADVAVLTSHVLVASGLKLLQSTQNSDTLAKLWTKSYLEACVGQSRDYLREAAITLQEQQDKSLEKTSAFFGYVGATLDLLLHQDKFEATLRVLGKFFQISNDIVDLLNLDTSIRIRDGQSYPIHLSYLMPMLVDNGVVEQNEVFELAPWSRQVEIATRARKILPTSDEMLKLLRNHYVKELEQAEINGRILEMCIEFMEHCSNHSFWNHDHETIS